MDTTYIDKMKDWIDLDNKTIELKEKLNEIANKKKELEDDITKYIEDNNFEKITVDVDDGHLKFQKRNTTQTISLKYLKSTLLKYHEEKEEINIDGIYDFLSSNLETKSKIYIKRDVR
jgi:hypothetical protein